MQDYKDWEPLLTQAQGNQSISVMLGDFNSSTNGGNYQGGSLAELSEFSDWLKTVYAGIPLIANCNADITPGITDQQWGDQAIAGCQSAEAAGAVHSLAVWSNWWSTPTPSALIPEIGTNDTPNYTYLNDILNYIQYRQISGTINGLVGGFSDQAVFGWACQIGSSLPVQVSVFAGDRSHGGQLLATAYASLESGDAIANQCQSAGNHFRYRIPLSSEMIEEYSGQALYITAGNSKSILLNSGAVLIE